MFEIQKKLKEMDEAAMNFALVTMIVVLIQVITIAVYTIFVPLNILKFFCYMNLYYSIMIFGLGIFILTRDHALRTYLKID